MKLENITPEIIRCQTCKLNQYLTQDKNCRRCHHALIQPVIPVLMPRRKSIPRPRLNRNVGVTIRLLRKALGLNQKAVTDRMNCQRTWLTKVESGRTLPTLRKLAQFAQIFDMPMSVLVTLLTVEGK